MKQPNDIMQNSLLHSKKIKHADEIKFKLRKAVYEIDRLSYEKGTRSGDYQIREIIREINEELDSYDSRITICEFGAGNSRLYKELLLFFEEMYLDNFSLHRKINSLKQTLEDQHKADAEHNISHKEKKYKRGPINSFRNELEKDLTVFENSLANKIIPSLEDFINNINDLLFYNSVNELMGKWSKSDSLNDREINRLDLNNSINYFIRINCKIQKKPFSGTDAMTLVDLLLNGMGIKSMLLNQLKIDQQEFEKIIVNSAREYCDNNNYTDKNTAGKKLSHLHKKGAPDDAGNNIEIALKNLQYLTEYKNPKTSIALPGNPGISRTKKYLFSSPGSGKILLKDIADYLKDSLLFINEWLLAELKKSQFSYDHLEPLFDCLPAEIGFYELYETANFISLHENNRKINILGDLMQYISNDMAEDIIHTTESICDELKDAFIKTIINFGVNRSAANIKLAKKIDIIFDSFDNARKKILKKMYSLE